MPERFHLPRKRLVIGGVGGERDGRETRTLLCETVDHLRREMLGGRCRSAVAAGEDLAALGEAVHHQACRALDRWGKRFGRIQLGLCRGLEMAENSVV